MDGLFGVGPLELIIVIALALVVLGPERLPDTIRQVVRFIKQTRAIGTELTKQFSDELNLLDDFNPKKILQDVVDLDEEFDGKELLGISKKDLKIDDVDLGNKATSSSKSKTSTNTKNPLSPPKGPKTPPLQSINKSKSTKPALGETDPEDTTTSQAVVAKKVASEGAESIANDNPADSDLADSDLADSDLAEVSPEPDTQNADSATPPKADGTESKQLSAASNEGLPADAVTENRIAPPSMSSAQSLVAGKPASATVKSPTSEEHKSKELDKDVSTDAKKASTASNNSNGKVDSVESSTTVNSDSEVNNASDSNNTDAKNAEDV